MSVHEDLSRLLDGDLSAGEAAALERRIETEPDVAAAWEQLQATVYALDGLSAGMMLPPAALDEAVLRRVAPVAPVAPARAGPAAWVVAAAGLVALAAAVLLGLRVPTPTTVAIGPGSSEFEGTLQVLVGDVVVDLDGRARIDVEPSGGAVRGGGQEVDMNHRTAILAALAGAAVTVTVYEGRAAVQGPDDTAPTELKAGATRTLPGRAAAGQPAAPVSDDAVREAELHQRVKELTDELDAIADELDTERFAGRLRDAELQRIQGVPSEWSDAVPEVLRPEAFEAELLPLTELPGFTVADVDCSEYPCVAALKYDGDDQTLDWGSDVIDRISTWADDHLEDASLTVNKSVFKDDDSEGRYLLFGLHDADPKGDVGQRTGARMDDLSDDLGNLGLDGGTEDVDVNE